MGPDPDPAPDPEPLHIPNPNPEPAPLPEEPTHADTLTAGPRKRSQFALRLAASALAVGGAVVACYNEVPGPQGPLPSPTREVPPQGPKPGPLVPAPHLIPPLDAGLPVPTPEGRTPNAAAPSSSSARLTIPAAGASPTVRSRGTRSAAPNGARATHPAVRVAQTTTTHDDATSANDDAPSSDPPPPTEPPQQQPPGSDAGVVDSPADLPPDLPDAGPIATADAGQPLGR
jgi:hypothetical protein